MLAAARFLAAAMAFSFTVAATAAALLTWITLNRRTVRGDYFVAVFVVTSLALYFSLEDFRECYAQAIALYITVLGSCTIAYRISPFHPLASYPGPFIWRLSSIVLAVVSLGGKRHEVLDRLHKTYGKFVRIGPNALSINSSTAGATIYGYAAHMEKSESYNKPGHVGGVALFFKQEQKEHADRKKIWLNGFSSNAIQHFFPPLERSTWDLMRCIDSRAGTSRVVDIGECINHWSYDFMGHMVFGGCNNLDLMRQGDPEELIVGGKKATVLVDCVGQTPWLMDILWHIPAGKALHRLREVSASMMRIRIKNAGEVDMKDLASYLISGDPVTGEKIPKSDLEVESLIAIQAGSDNTGSAMTLMFYFLLSRPNTYEKLRSTLDSAFPDPMDPLDHKKLAEIPLLDAVINETLRLGTPFFLPRIVPDGGRPIDGRFVPEGTIVALSAYSQQVDASNFSPDPLQYIPERWLPGGLGPTSVLNKAAVVSFSSGPYVCIAKSFAMQEMRFVIARMLLAYDLDYAPDFDCKEFMKGFCNMRTTVFNYPLKVKVTRRSSSAFPEL